ncbi:MAG: hypothetical protein EOM11_05870 [Erysipelotrichia bacterium]|nr:hypothetical protein [Erysipelotrichia bacterium]
MALKLAISKAELIELTNRQLSFFMCSNSIEKYLDTVLEKLDVCFESITNKYYHNDDMSFFSPFQSAQYAQYLYFLSREAYLQNDKEVAEKTYYLNVTV